jgi:hypothetical protein
MGGIDGNHDDPYVNEMGVFVVTSEPLLRNIGPPVMASG